MLSLLVSSLLSDHTSAQCNDIGPAVIKGKRFFDSKSGKHIHLKGINYYPRPNGGTLDVNAVDFFTDEYESVWRPDVEHFVALGVNVLRLFAVDPSKSHDKFMCALKQVGIYVVVGLAAPCDNCHIINDLSPPDCYPSALKTRGQFIINTFSRYDNTLAFSAGNEANLESAISGQPVEFNAACQKQFLRDMREFIMTCPTLRKIPVGLSLADINRKDNAMYYSCRTNFEDPWENADFYGLNIYQHCNGNDPDITGFQRMLQDFEEMELPIPVVLTEFGCVNDSFPNVGEYEAQRDFRQVPMVFGHEEMAGAFAFEYSTERWNAILANSDYPFTRWGYGNYGVGYYSPGDCNHQDIPCTYMKMPQFDTLANEFSAVNDIVLPDFDDYVPTVRDYPVCPERFVDVLADIPWGSADIENMGCAWWPDEFVCPFETSTECQLLPTLAPTPDATPAPVVPATNSPTSLPTPGPTLAPIIPATTSPTAAPVLPATVGPTVSPTALEVATTVFPTTQTSLGVSPTTFPTVQPTIPDNGSSGSSPISSAATTTNPTKVPSVSPMIQQTGSPTLSPTTQPTATPVSTIAPTTAAPTASLRTTSPTTTEPSASPTTLAPTTPVPTETPTSSPSEPTTPPILLVFPINVAGIADASTSSRRMLHGAVAILCLLALVF